MGEFVSDGAYAGEGDHAEPSEEAFGGKHQTVFHLGSKHPTILITPTRIAAQVVCRPEETEVVNGNPVACSRATHGPESKHLMFAQGVVFVETDPVVLIAPLAA